MQITRISTCWLWHVPPFTDSQGAATHLRRRRRKGEKEIPCCLSCLRNELFFFFAAAAATVRLLHYKQQVYLTKKSRRLCSVHPFSPRLNKWLCDTLHSAPAIARSTIVQTDKNCNPIKNSHLVVFQSVSSIPAKQSC